MDNEFKNGFSIFAKESGLDTNLLSTFYQWQELTEANRDSFNKRGMSVDEYLEHLKPPPVRFLPFGSKAKSNQNQINQDNN